MVFGLRARRLALPANVPDNSQSGPDQRHRTEEEDAVQNLHPERITKGEVSVEGGADRPGGWLKGRQ